MGLYKLNNWMTVSDVVVAAAVDRSVYERAVRAGVIARPTHKLRGGRRAYYTADEAAGIVAQLRVISGRRDIPAA